MYNLIRDFGATAILMCLIIAGGRKVDAYLIGIYGGSYVISDILNFVLPFFK